MSLKAGKILRGEEEERYSKRGDYRVNNKRKFERKFDRNWWYIGFEGVIGRVWGRERRGENYNKDVSFTE